MKRITLLILAILLLSQNAFASTLSESAFEGFALEKIEKGKKVYSLKAEEATFGNKKIGFFNFGLIKVINLKGVEFTTFSDGKLEKSEQFPEAVFEINTGRLLDKDGNLLFCGSQKSSP